MNTFTRDTRFQFSAAITGMNNLNLLTARPWEQYSHSLVVVGVSLNSPAKCILMDESSVLRGVDHAVEVATVADKASSINPAIAPD
jgi:hypothetical protein